MKPRRKIGHVLCTFVKTVSRMEQQQVTPDSTLPNINFHARDLSPSGKA